MLQSENIFNVPLAKKYHAEASTMRNASLIRKQLSHPKRIDLPVHIPIWQQATIAESPTNKNKGEGQP
jgi:hypothetical protein